MKHTFNDNSTQLEEINLKNDRYKNYGYDSTHQQEFNQIECLRKTRRGFIDDPEFRYVEIEFDHNRRNLYCNCNKFDLKVGDFVIVETPFGEDLGAVYSHGKLAYNKACRLDFDTMPDCKIIRYATDEDLIQEEENIIDQKELAKIAQNLANHCSLNIEIIKSEWQWDRRKATFIFKAPEMVDFRAFVRELSLLIGTKIEMRQISLREEIKISDSVFGTCGRETCCSSFLHNFVPISRLTTKMQNIPDNIAKINGNCHNVKCCMRYEEDNYSAVINSLPSIGSVIKIEEDEYILSTINIFHEYVVLKHTVEHRIMRINFEELKSQDISI